VGAGLRLAGEARFPRNPEDTRDCNTSPREAGERPGTSDRFVLKLVKPRSRPLNRFGEWACAAPSTIGSPPAFARI
jgi:hypothetical protein